MTKEESVQLKENAQQAFAQLRVEVIERARQTGTPVITWRDGKVCELHPDEIQHQHADPKNEGL